MPQASLVTLRTLFEDQKGPPYLCQLNLKSNTVASQGRSPKI